MTGLPGEGGRHAAPRSGLRPATLREETRVATLLEAFEIAEADLIGGSYGDLTNRKVIPRE